MEDSTDNFAVEVTIVLAPEREAPTEEGVEQNAHGPNVCTEAGVLFPGHNLWGHVGRSSTKDLQLLSRRHDGGEAKIDNLHLGHGKTRQLDLCNLWEPMATFNPCWASSNWHQKSWTFQVGFDDETDWGTHFDIFLQTPLLFSVTTILASMELSHARQEVDSLTSRRGAQCGGHGGIWCPDTPGRVTTVRTRMPCRNLSSLYHFSHAHHTHNRAAAVPLNNEAWKIICHSSG